MKANTSLEALATAAAKWVGWETFELEGDTLYRVPGTVWGSGTLALLGGTLESAVLLAAIKTKLCRLDYEWSVNHDQYGDGRIYASVGVINAEWSDKGELAAMLLALHAAETIGGDDD